MEAERIAERIAASDLTIYDKISHDSRLYFGTPTLEARLREKLVGLNLDFAIRRRAKVAKEAVAQALGYSVPTSFKKTRPRFPGQDLDVYVQQADNLQIWNEEVDPERRYVLLRPNTVGRVEAVRVITGEVLQALDRTGVLTSKYQAKRRPGHTGSVLVSNADTRAAGALVGDIQEVGAVMSRSRASDLPREGALYSIAAVYDRLSGIAGRALPNPGRTQERLRGEALQALVSHQLGIGEYVNVGQWPDIVVQALEVKLQTSPTVDLGLVLPSSELEAASLGMGLRHADIRYAIIYGEPTDSEVVLTDIVVTAGVDFFSEFRQFGGLEVNRKLQIPLPKGFFEAE